MFDDLFEFAFGSGPHPAAQPYTAALVAECLESRDVPAAVTANTFAQDQQMALNAALGLQLPNGAFRSSVELGVVTVNGKQVKLYEVDPWRAMRATLALLQSNVSPDRTVPAALRAATWFLQNRAPDGAPPGKHWVDGAGVKRHETGVDDRSAANSAFLQVVCELYRAAPRDAQVRAFLNSNRAAIFGVAYDLVKLADPKDGLVWVFKPDTAQWKNYPAKLLAGNAEAVSALWRFAHEIAGGYYQNPQQRDYYLSFHTGAKDALIREMVPADPSKVRILKHANGTYEGLSVRPNFEKFDRYPPSFLINEGIVAGNSALGRAYVRYLFDRHPNWTKGRPAEALTFYPELGVMLVRAGDTTGAVRYTRTVLDAVFTRAGQVNTGYFTVDCLGWLVTTMAMTGKSR